MDERIKRAMIDGVMTGLKDRVAGISGNPKHDQLDNSKEFTRLWQLGEHMLDMIAQLDENEEIRD